MRATLNIMLHDTWVVYRVQWLSWFPYKSIHQFFSHLIK